MSLREAYTLAHSAQCRLQVEASRPDRNLRFLVGHLLHYESMRLRIVEIEHEHADPKRVIRRPSPVPSADKYGVLDELDNDDDSWSDEDSDDYEQDDDYADDEDGRGEGLGLQRFPSASSQPQRHGHVVPEKESKKHHDASRPDPTEEELQHALKSPPDSNMLEMYRRVRDCECNASSDAPPIERAWELPSDPGSQDGVLRILAEVGA